MTAPVGRMTVMTWPANDCGGAIMHQIWAVAKNLIAEVVRMKFLMAFLACLVLVYTVGFAYWLGKGGSSVETQLQTFLSYSLSATLHLLGLLTIFVSAASISRDIKRKEIFTIATKSISRGQFLLGKLIGMLLFNAVLLLAIGGVIYGLVMYMAGAASVKPEERERIDQRVLVARRPVAPPLPDVSAEVRKQVEKAMREHSEDPTYQGDSLKLSILEQNLTSEWTNNLTMRARAVGPGHSSVFHFSGITPADRSDGYVYIRYKPDVSVNPEDLMIHSVWAYGPEDPLVAGARGSHTSKDRIRTFHEFPVPVSTVSDQGDLYVVYHNPFNPTAVIFPTEGGIEALYVAGGFEANFGRALLAMYLRLMFLSALGLALGASLSFPVAVLFALVVYLLGLSSGFVLDAVRWEASGPQELLISYTMLLFPQFSAYDPVGYIEKGRIVSYGLLADCALWLVCIKGGILAVFGYVVFRMRELARVIV